VLHQRVDGGGTEDGTALHALGRVRPAAFDQQRQVLATLAQRRHRNADDVEAIQQIEAEAAGLHLVPQLPIGGRDHADVDAARQVLADAADLALL